MKKTFSALLAAAAMLAACNRQEKTAAVQQEIGKNKINNITQKQKETKEDTT